MKHYLIDWHMGGYSWSDEEINFYCDTCGDSDTTVLIYDDEDDKESDSIIELFAEISDLVYGGEAALDLIYDLGKDRLLVEQIEHYFEELSYKRGKEE